MTTVVQIKKQICCTVMLSLGGNRAETIACVFHVRDVDMSALPFVPRFLLLHTETFCQFIYLDRRLPCH